MLSNYHTHSHYCDGQGELRDYVEYALGHNFCALGFSGHAPVPFANTFAIKDEEYEAYCREVRQLQQEYAGRIELKLGLEIDYIPGVLDDFSDFIRRGGLDYFIGSVHLLPHPSEAEQLRQHKSEAAERLWFIDGSRQEIYDEGLHKLFGGDIRAGVRAFFHQNNAMIEQLPRWAAMCGDGRTPAIVGHVDKIVMHNKNRYFHYDEPWFRDLLYETLQLIKETGCICEINTRGIYKGRHSDFYPAKESIRHMNTLGIPVLVGSDAHAPDNLDRFEGAYEFLKEIGYREVVETI